MKNNLRQNIIISAIVILAGIALIGCSHPLAEGGTANKTGTVIVTVSGGDARTALPHTPFDRHSLSFTAKGKETITRTLTGSAAETVELDPGLWAITAKGFVEINDEYYEAATGSEPLSVAAGTEYSVTIVLNSPSGGAPGTFVYSIALPASVTLTEARLKLTPLGGTGVVHDFDLLGDSVSNPLTLDLAAGYYLMTITLTDGTLDAGGTEVVHIYPNMETRIDRIFTESDFVEDVLSLEGKILILQVYGSGTSTDGAVSRSFVELYNKTDAAVSLDNCSLQYSDGGNVWQNVDLSGKTIPAHASFLILGKAQNIDSRLVLADADADSIAGDMLFDNHNFKVALMQHNDALTVANPFDTDGEGAKAAGYIDMVGVKNGGSDVIDGFEEDAPAVISKQKAARRKTLTDTDNNGTDFESIDYRATGTTPAECDFYRPRNSLYGAWDPVYAAPPVLPTVSLLILQAYGAGTSTNGAVSHSFIELYNNTGAAINLTGYSVQYSAGGTTWETLDLSGKSVPAYTSFLILGKAQNVGSRLVLSESDADSIWADKTFDNHNFKICLINSLVTLTVANPFDTDGAGAKVPGYIDMVGVINAVSDGDSIDGFETATSELISKQKAARRKNLTDTDNNQYDFESIDYRTSDLAKYRPRNSANGSWNPLQ
jgi:hypothetical protein